MLKSLTLRRWLTSPTPIMCERTEPSLVSVALDLTLLSSRRYGKRSLRPFVAGDRSIDPGHQLWRQRTGVSGGYALGKLRTVLHAKHQCIDIERQGVTMRQRGRGHANLLS